jgi:sulfur-oxidizing protein SoxA
MRVLVLAVIVATGVAAAGEEIAPGDRRSGYDFAGPDTRAMQDYDTANPGMLGVLQGETLWASKAGATNWSCGTATATREPA